MAKKKKQSGEPYSAVKGYLRENPRDLGAISDYFEEIRSRSDDSEAKIFLKSANRLLLNPDLEFKDRVKLHSLVKNGNLFLAPRWFHNFMIYLEWEREPKKRFYQPRVKALRPIVDNMQDLSDGKIEILSLSCPPGIGKSTLALFYLAFEGGKHPDLPNLGCSHNAAFLKGLYDELLRIVDPEGEYLYNDVFPTSPLVNTNAKDLRIDLQTEKRFETFEFTSVGAGNAGKVRAMNLLYCDDLVDGIETALSITQLDKLWGQYYTDLRQRKQGDACKELHIATRWSVHDVIGRLQEQYEGDPSARFLAFPALNEKDESNFDYPYGLGFSTEFYHKQRDIMDDASWKALYMNEPIEREGLLYEEDQLQYYMQLPDGEPDTVIAVCDTKDKGSDFCSMPIFYQYGDKFFLEDLIYDDGLPDRIDPRIVSRLIKNKVKLCQFESNAGGGRVAQDIDKDMRAKGGTTTITTKFTTQNKGTKIFVNAGWVKENVVFKDSSKQDKEYRTFMNAICSYTHVGKNAHDDAPDSLAMFAELVQGIAGTRVEVRRRWF